MLGERSWLKTRPQVLDDFSEIVASRIALELRLFSPEANQKFWHPQFGHLH